MTKTLLIELKDKHANATLITAKDKWSVVFSETYEYNDLNMDKNDFVEFNWINKMKRDLQEVIDVSDISHKALILNVSELNINSDVIKVDTNTDTDVLKDELKLNFKKANPGITLTNLTINRVKESKTKNEVFYTTESISRELLRKIQSAFTLVDLHIDIFVPVNKAIYNGVKPLVKEGGTVLYVEIDDDQMILSLYKHAKPIYQKKKLIGLSYVYENIEKKMGINIYEAKKLFNLFGSIPPEAIKEKDNRIIYTREDHSTRQVYSFDKKDLSTYITEAVNGLFGIIFEELKHYKKDDIDVLFSGQIVKLKGFIDYSKITLGMKSIKVFDQHSIGIAQESALIQIGGIKYVLIKTKQNLASLEKPREEKVLPFSKKLKIWKDRITRFYNYL